MSAAELVKTQDGVEPTITEEQRSTAVWRHPQREDIVALLAKRSADWIAAWLREQYPLEDEDGEPHPQAAAHERWRLSARAIERYRKKFSPETIAGLDLLPVELEDLIGHKLPAGSPRRELELLESLQNAALHNLAKAMASDEEMEMLQPITLEAQKQAIQAAVQAVDVKSKLGVAGYEAAPQQWQIDQQSTNRNVNIELHGRTDRHGRPVANEPEKVNALRDLLQLGPEHAELMLNAAREATSGADVGADVEGEAEEVAP